MRNMKKELERTARILYQRELAALNPRQLHEVVARTVMEAIAPTWEKCRNRQAAVRRAYYLSAEFLVGRAVGNNLLCAGLYNDAAVALKEAGVDMTAFEDIEDAALGNGGLGRLAACFLDSAATLGLPLDGYGIRYRYGLFRQQFEDGFQKETADDWGATADPWSVRREEDTVTVTFGDGPVKAVPYDMPIIGYGGKSVSTLRLWQAEPVTPFDFTLFNDQQYDKAVREKNRAEDISRVLYPNDSTPAGRLLRLKQQYFFSSASMQDALGRFEAVHGTAWDKLADYITVQLNDTHPVMAIPELIRLLGHRGVDFETALAIATKVFNYTNHTIMQEALEKWDMATIRKVSPEIAAIIRQISRHFDRLLEAKKVVDSRRPHLQILQGNTVHMAYLACFVSSHINGVAEIHTEILKRDVLADWHALYPKKIRNMTNGITQRRWLALCNPALTALLAELCGHTKFVTDLNRLAELEDLASDETVLRRFIAIKEDNKQRLAAHIRTREGVTINPQAMMDVQIKRLHEYKRQLLNILCILELYFEIKEGTLTDFAPTTFLFGAKAAPGYFRAKGIIKLIHEVAALIAADDKASKVLQVVFVTDYNVSYAEKIVAAADVSEQISTAGTEASGTGNMKLMLNGAVTLGTYDGANIEIVREAGEENNYIFGARVEEIDAIRGDYDPVKLYEADPRIRRCVDALTDGTLDDGGTGMFKELQDALLKGASWHQPDHYFLLHDFDACLQAKKQVNRDYATDRLAFAAKQWHNICAAGHFSSDRTIAQYAKQIWKIKK